MFRDFRGRFAESLRVRVSREAKDSEKIAGNADGDLFQGRVQGYRHQDQLHAGECRDSLAPSSRRWSADDFVNPHQIQAAQRHASHDGYGRPRNDASGKQGGTKIEEQHVKKLVEKIDSQSPKS